MCLQLLTDAESEQCAWHQRFCVVAISPHNRSHSLINTRNVLILGTHFAHAQNLCCIDYTCVPDDFLMGVCPHSIDGSKPECGY